MDPDNSNLPQFWNVGYPPGQARDISNPHSGAASFWQDEGTGPGYYWSQGVIGMAPGATLAYRFWVRGVYTEGNVAMPYTPFNGATYFWGPGFLVRFGRLAVRALHSHVVDHGLLALDHDLDLEVPSAVAFNDVPLEEHAAARALGVRLHGVRVLNGAPDDLECPLWLGELGQLFARR